MSRKKGPGPVIVPPPDDPPEATPSETIEETAPETPQLPPDPGPEFTDRPVKEGRGHHKEPSAGIFARLSELTAEDWDRYDIYLYRLAPIIDQSLAGKASFITKYREKIDESRVLHDFGSGGYRVCLNKLTDSGSSTNIFRGDFNILNYDFPPKVVPGTWVDDPRNAKWAWAKPKDPTAPPPPSSAGDPLALLATVEAMMDRRDARLRESMRANGPKESVLDAVRIGMEMSKPEADTKATDRSFDLMMAQLNALRDENRDMTKRYLDLLTNQAPPKNTTEQLEDTARLIDAVEKIRPRRGHVEEQHPVMDLMEKLLVPVVEAAAPVLSLAIQRGMQQQPKPAARPAAQAATSEPAAVTPEVLPAGGQLTVQKQIPKVLADHFMMAYLKMQQGWTGTDFANWLHAGYPDAINALRQIGATDTPPVQPVDAIIEIARGIPQIWALIGPVPGAEQKLRTFLAEIIVWQEPAEEAETEEQAS